MKKKYLTEWDRRHAWRVANRRCIASTACGLIGSAGITGAIVAGLPPLVILAASLFTLAACVASGWHLAKRQLARP